MTTEQETERYSLTQLAKLAIDFGFVPIPLKGKRPYLPRWQQTTNQTSLRKIKDGEKTGTADNIGILTGKPSGVVVVDVDVNKGGLDFWEELISKNRLPKTFTLETGSGGLHYYFAYDETTQDLRNATAAIKKKGIDVKTTGGQVVFAGSIHPETGVMYDIIDGIDEETQEPIIAPMPSWLLQLLTSNQKELDAKYPRKYLQ